MCCKDKILEPSSSIPYLVTVLSSSLSITLGLGAARVVTTLLFLLLLLGTTTEHGKHGRSGGLLSLGGL